MQSILKMPATILTLGIVKSCSKNKGMPAWINISGRGTDASRSCRHTSAGWSRLDLHTLPVCRDRHRPFRPRAVRFLFLSAISSELHIGKNVGMEAARQEMRQDRRLVAVDRPGAILQKRLTGA